VSPSSPAAALHSMTGFARVEGEAEGVSWVWEAKSVNARGLDVRNRVPPGYDRFDPMIRDALRKRLTRGTVSVSLTLIHAAGGRRYRLNDDLLGAVADALPALRAALPDAAPPTLDGVLGVRGLFEADDATAPAASEAVDAALTAGLDALADALAAHRRAEGAALCAILTAHVASIANLIADARASDAVAPAAIQQKLRAQIDALVGDAAPVSDERLAQEVAILATKADVREELDRLDGHVQQAEALLTAGGAVGRKLDFLAQEFNREANTLCAKAGDQDLGRIGLALKAVIDQFKEQVQNVE
jgi:uncharacterized protein (TIGR00255 family)